MPLEDESTQIHTCVNCGWDFEEGDGWTSETCSSDCHTEYYGDDCDEEECQYSGSNFREELGEMPTSRFTVGVELECTGAYTSDVSRRIHQLRTKYVDDGSIKLGARIGTKTDGSVTSPSCELVTPPASGAGIAPLIDLATEAARDSGCWVDSTCGIHVHFGGLNGAGGGEIARIVNTFAAVERCLLAMLPRSRRNNSYAVPITNGVFDGFLDVDTMKTMSDVLTWFNGRPNSSGRYLGLNLHAWRAHGTLEVRYHSGSLNRTKIVNWVRILSHVMSYAVERYNQGELAAFLFKDMHPYDRVEYFSQIMRMPEDLTAYMRDRTATFSGIPAVDSAGLVDTDEPEFKERAASQRRSVTVRAETSIIRRFVLRGNRRHGSEISERFVALTPIFSESGGIDNSGLVPRGTY